MATSVNQLITWNDFTVAKIYHLYAHMPLPMAGSTFGFQWENFRQRC